MIKIFRLLMILVAFTACSGNMRSDFIVATAANVQFAMEELLTEFEKQTGYHGEIVLGSSGKLTSQIREGAPYDIFVSADMVYPTVLYQADLTYGPPETYAYGVLVLWTASQEQDLTLMDLKKNSIEHVAIANTTTAPYGRAAKEVLERSKLWDMISPKLVYAESVAQVNQFVISKSAQAGFTAKSIVVSKEMKDVGRWIEIEPSMYSPIEQGVVTIRREGQNVEVVNHFYQFMFSSSARNILLDHGYTLKN